MCRIRTRHYYDPELKRTTDGRYACDIYEEVNGHTVRVKTYINEDYRKLMRFVHGDIAYLDTYRPYMSLYEYMKWKRNYKFQKSCLRG